MAEEDGVSKVTEVTTASWLQRLGQALAGVLFGVLAIVVSVVLLLWNEGRAVKTAQGLTEGAGIVVSVSANHIDSGNNGRLVHVTGSLTSSGPIADPDFAVRSRGVRLLRTVEMYQWKEETQTESRAKLGGGEERVTTYRYVRGWSDKPVDSSRFKEPRGHTNPLMPYQSREILAAGTRLGAYAVPDSLLRGFGEAKPLPANDAQANALQIRINKPVTIHDGMLYAGRDVQQPAIGDVRVSFSEVPLQTASIVAAQSGTSLVPLTTHSGTTVELITAGAVPAEAMFQAAQEENAALTWILRGAGVFLMFAGFALTMRPLGVVGDVLPAVGTIIRAGTGLVALVGTAALASVVIGLGWLWYRPLIGIAVLLIGGAATWALARIARSRAVRTAAT
jgi:hypothetical protein